jgi:DNA-binding beta-propeller fold protein YncE
VLRYDEVPVDGGTGLVHNAEGILILAFPKVHVMRSGRKSMLNRFLRLLVYALLMAGVSILSPAEDDYHLTMKYLLGGDGGWDYLTLDGPSRRLYISHRDHVNVLDVDSRAVVGDIGGMHLVHSIVLVKDIGRGFISDGGGPTALGPAGDRVVMFDLETLRVIGEIKTSPNPDCLVYDPASRRVFSFSGVGRNVSVIDPEKGTVITTVSIGGKVEYSVADGRGMIYSNIEDTNEIVVLDTRALTIKARWPVAPAGTPTAIAMDREHRLLFSAGRNPRKLVVVNADNGRVIQSFPIGGNVDAVVYEPETGLIFASTGEGRLDIFREDSPAEFKKVQTVYTQPGARTMAIDPTTHNVFLVTADFGPAPAPLDPRPRILPGTFVLLIYGR